MAKSKESEEKSPIWRALIGYHHESDTARRSRLLQNEENFSIFNLEQSWAHKIKGQSKEFLPKQANSVEQITSFLQQGLVDMSDWYGMERQPGVSDADVLFTVDEMKKLLSRQLSKNDFVTHISDSLKAGQLQSLMITKVGGLFDEKVRYVANKPFLRKATLEKKTEKVWRLNLSLVRAQDYYPDPYGTDRTKMYEQEAIEIDLYRLMELAKENPQEFDSKEIEGLAPNPDYMQELKKARETGQDPVVGGERKRIRIIEHWGDICDPDTGELLHRNALCRITMEGKIITPARKNPLWHGQSPYVVSPIIRVPWSVWHRALMDAPSKLNRALNELFNLQFDSGMMSVFGIKQIREDYLENPGEVSDGIAPGATLKVTESTPPGMKVLERVDSGSLTEEALNMFQVADREYQASSFSPDTRNAVLSQRAVKATEVVANNQNIEGVFKGIVRIIEEKYVAPILDKSWMTCAQHMNDLDNEEVKALIGEGRANLLSMLTPEERFAKTALGHKYKVYGMSQTLNKIQDFRKITTLLQTIGSSEVLMREYMRKYSMTKTMAEIVKSLDISEDKIVASQEELQQRAAEQQQAMEIAMMQAQSKGGKRPLEGGANVQSQIPQMNAQGGETGMKPGNPANDQGMTEVA